MADTTEQLLPRPKRATGCASMAQVHAFANLLKTMIGSGLLTLPWATGQFGLVLSLVGLVYLAYLSQAAIRMMVRCVAFSPLQRKTLVDELRHTGSLRDSRRPTAGSHGSQASHDDDERLSGVPLSRKSSVVADGHGAGSWQIISVSAGGEPARIVTIVLLTLAQAGASVSYFDFVCDTMAIYLGTARVFNIFSLWAVLCVLSLLKQLKSVAWLSAAGLLTYLFVLALVVDFGTQAIDQRGGLSAPPAPKLVVPAGLGAWFGPALFAFEGMGTALSIYEAMEDADPQPYFAVVSATYAISYGLYAGVGAFGYVAWGGGVEKVILDSFPHYNTSVGAVHTADQDLTMAAHLALSLILALSFVLQMTPVYHVIEDLLHNPDHSRLPASWWPLTRAAIVGVIAVVGALVPDMETMISLTGSVAFSAIGFVLPGAFFLLLRPPATRAPAPPVLTAAGGGAGEAAFGVELAPPPTRLSDLWDFFVAYLLIVTGVVGGTLGVISTFTSD